jgi:RimJ/RimL family protein N-acetyltransferase
MRLSSEIRTERLILRSWRADDRGPFADPNSDPQVMEFMPRALSAKESDAFADRIEEHFRQHGFGLYATELRSSGIFIGFVGLHIPAFQTAFTPCVEIGWRLASAYWGQGLAAEGAQAALCYGFQRLGLQEVVSFTVPANLRSRRVMEKLGMKHNPAEDFLHPRLPADHRLSRHVLYRVPRAEWSKTQGVTS